MKKIFIFVTAVMFFTSCNSLKVADVETSKASNILSVSDVSKNEYVLTNLYPEANLTLGFDNYGRIFGYSGLNRYFGKVEIKDGNIVINPLAATKVSGSQEAFIREHIYLSLLKSMTKIEKKQNTLVLSNDKDEKLIFSIK